MTDFNENGCDDLELLDGMCDSVTAESFLEGYSDFYRETEESKIWWIDKIDVIGEILFSFDKKKIYNLFLDYPHNMTEEEVRIFDRENPYWRDFFSDRIWTIVGKTVKNSHYKKTSVYH